MKYKKTILCLLALSLVLSLFILPVHAVDVYESENNNTVTNADVTYDDYNNYGSLSSSTDVDWWTFTPTATGSANVWLGNIPSNCHYNLYLYEFDGETLIAQATQFTDDQLINARVYAGVTYTVKISSVSGYANSNYLFRVKNYTAARKARYFTFYDDVYDGENGVLIDFRAGFRACSSTINSMGYTTGNSYELTGKQVYENMPNYDLVHVESHAEPGRLNCGGSSYLYGSTVIYDANINQGMGNYAYEALKKAKLIVMMGCNSGVNDSLWGNLGAAAYNKGAHCSFGWMTEIAAVDAVPWQEEFYTLLSYGDNVGEALDEVKAIMWEEAVVAEEINSVFAWGDPYSLTLC